jgi:hypothetical protein
MDDAATTTPAVGRARRTEAGRGGTVVEVDPRADGRWEEYLARHPDALVYHHPLWLEVLTREYAQPVTGLLDEDEAGRCQGVLPLLCTRGLPFGLGGPTLGRRLSSLPRTPLAGPLATDDDAEARLLRGALERVAAGGARLQIKAPRPLSTVDALTSTPWRESFVLDLPDDPDALRFGASRNHGRITWAVRRAAKGGVSVREAESRADVRAWYRLYLETMRWHLVPPRPWRFFEACWELLVSPGLMRMLVAERQEGARRTLLAGSIFLTYGSTEFYAFNGRRRDALALRPNDTLLWHAMRDACRRGVTRFDLGEVTHDNDGLAEFKSKWGATSVWLHRSYYPPPDGSRGTRDSEPAGGRARVVQPGWSARDAVRAAWRRVPLGATARAGEYLYAFL